MAIPLVDVLIRSAGLTWQGAGLFMRPGHMHNHLRLCLNSRRLTSRQESSVCSRSFFVPVESVSPPRYKLRLQLKDDSPELKVEVDWREYVRKSKFG
jgi:hypothetical protein